MKKILSIALVALIAVTSAFAGFTGSASVGLGYNFQDKTYGFSNASSTKIEIESEYLSSAIDNAGEGEIYAGIKAAFTITAKSSKDGVKFVVDPNAVSEAYLTNGAWTVSILGSGSGIDFAKSAIDTYKDGNKDKAVTYAVPFTAAPGVKLSYADWTIGAGFKGTETTFDYSVAVTAPEFDFDGLKLQAAAVASQSNKAAVDAVAPSYALDTKTGKIVVVKGTDAVPASETTAIGASAKASFANDTLSASVAADLGFEDIKSDVVAINFDAAANVAVAPVAVDVYFNWNAIAAQSAPARLLSAKVVTDLAAFEVPVKLTVTGKDLINTQALTAKAEVTVSEALSASVEGGFKLSDKSWSVAGAATYATDAYTVKAGVNYLSAKVLYANASIESSTVIPGATVSLGYGPCKDASGNVTSNLLAEKYGKIDATCKIAF